MALVLEAPPACSSPMMGITLAECFSERAKSLVMPDRYGNIVRWGISTLATYGKVAIVITIIAR
jgi:hypothetical protein